jgi:hypothetical protein
VTLGKHSPHPFLSGSVNSFSVFQTYYEVHQLSTSTPSEIAWIGSLQVSARLGI